MYIHGGLLFPSEGGYLILIPVRDSGAVPCPWGVFRGPLLWETLLLSSSGCERSRIVDAMYFLYCKVCARLGGGVKSLKSRSVPPYADTPCRRCWRSLCS